MSTETITDERRLAILKHLASGKDLDVVATIVHLPRSAVLDVASQHGYPDTDKLAWAADIIQNRIRNGNTIPERTPVPTPRPVATAAPRSTAAPQSPTLTPRTDEVLALINTAKQHSSKRIQRAADKLFGDINRLRGLIREDEERHAERRRLEAEKAAARAEVERLEAQLAAARAKLRPKTTVTAGSKKTTTPKGEYGCRNDGCDRIYDTPQGRSMHERLRCEHRPEAQAS